MASKNGMLLGGCLALIGGTALVSCGGCVAFVLFWPAMLGWAFLDERPLAVAFPAPDAALAQAAADRIAAELAATHSTLVTTDELTQLALRGADEHAQLRIASGRPDQLTLDLSMVGKEEAQYFNVHLAGSFLMEHGRVTSMSLDEAEVAGWDLGYFVAGMDLAQGVNDYLAQEREIQPELAATLDGVVRLATERGGVVLTRVAEGEEGSGAGP